MLTRVNITSIHDTKKWNEFKLIEFQPKAFEDYDVDIKIEYCGVCGSDVRLSVHCSFDWSSNLRSQVHTITGGWGQPSLVRRYMRIIPFILAHISTSLSYLAMKS
jgi:hypothetical protein